MTSVREVSVGPAGPTVRVREAYARIRDVDRPEVWITLRDEREVLADATAIETRLANGDDLPLAGWLVAVKDNIDVAGLPTTAACPDYEYAPNASAIAVQRLVAAGAIILGKTNLDQFATGLVGTRSPYGAVRNAGDPSLISGGSSSGSAVAVALGLVDIALGTDTAGSGRVPAAFQGIVGVKPTLGIVATSGVVPASIDYDAVSVFARSVGQGAMALRTIVGTDVGDSRSRAWPGSTPLAAPEVGRLLVPTDQNLDALVPSYRDAFAATVAHARATGFAIETVDIDPLIVAARRLYDGAVLAQRYDAVGAFLDTRPASADPTVSSIILAAVEPRAHEYVADLTTLADTRQFAAGLLADHDALLLPTTTEHPTIAAVLADPVGINRRLGTYTNFCNLLDLAAVAVPGTRTTDDMPFGVTVVVPAFHDQVALDIAARLTGADAPPLVVDLGVDVAVFGAHLRGQPLNHQLESLGARFVEPVATSAAYRLVALDTAPPKPGLVRYGTDQGAPIAGELWRLTPDALGRFLAALPSPMALTRVELDDGRDVVGFACTYEAAIDATDITEYGGWVAYLNR